MYRYKYVHDVPVAFPDLHFLPHKGYVHPSNTPINHPYWELIEPEVVEPKPTDEVTEIESPVAADNKELTDALRIE